MSKRTVIRKALKHDFTDFVYINGVQACKHCHITRNNEFLPTYCYDKKEDEEE